MFKTRTNILAAVLIGNLLATVASATRPSPGCGALGATVKPYQTAPIRRVLPIRPSTFEQLNVRITAVTVELSRIDVQIGYYTRELWSIIKSGNVNDRRYAVYFKNLDELRTLRNEGVEILRDLHNKQYQALCRAALSKPKSHRGGGMRCILVPEKKAGGRPSTPGAK
ncbi:MAG: hypothetical protein QGG42_12125 [Phycisphaerae bacterium]|jgi:hypothetical protein|nr:hypothetical protein [Phycisphaerae bacterium]